MPDPTGPPSSAHGAGAQPSGDPSQLPPIPSTPTATSLTSARRSATSRTRSTVGHRLGAGLVEIPPIPARDPADAVMADPMVPENRRFCATCDEPVGRGRDGTPGRAAGFCRKCGSPFSFEPKLGPGDLVARQYEVVGCLAHGGMGWVYLARDRNVSDRWVVLKGLLNADDRDATAAALAERRFLAEVEHPNIVKIFNFVEHEGSGYIVMEYVGGQSLKQILTARRDANGGEPDPLPPDQAIAYVLEILPALGYLHDLGLLFCDFKVDNVIQTQHSLKLIDLGGVYRIDEPTSALFGTAGYQAPEIATLGPSIPSDLFTVARTLAVLCIDFRGYQSTYRFTLPAAGRPCRCCERYDSLYRFLLKGTAPNPDDRFQSAEEMADQLFGVLREVVADCEGVPVPAPSKLFTAPMRAGLGAARLADPAAPAGVERRPERRLPGDDHRGGPRTADRAAARGARAHRRGRPAARRGDDRRWLARRSGSPARRDRGDRPVGVASRLVPRDRRAGAQTAPTRLGRASRPSTARVPGELAPKLALGLACESAGRPRRRRPAGTRSSREPIPRSRARRSAWRAAGSQAGDRAGALAAYERVPDTSSGYIDAQTAGSAASAATARATRALAGAARGRVGARGAGAWTASSASG